MAHTRDELEVRLERDRGSQHLLEVLDSLPSLFGGDGRTREMPVVVNSVSGALAKLLIRNHITKTLGGRSGVDWKKVKVTEIEERQDYDGHVECHTVETLVGTQEKFYFDLSRSHGANLYLLKRAYEIQMLGEAEVDVGAYQ